MNALPEQRHRNRRSKLFAVLPTLLTLGNGVCGFGAITLLARLGPYTPESPGFFEAQMVAAAYLIFLAMLFDGLDGSVARLTNQASDFGAQLDSLCDVISFGVAPAFLMLKLTHEEHHLLDTVIRSPFYYPPRVLWPIATLFLICVVLRLARFTAELDEGDSHDEFIGLPSPAAAGVIAGFPIGIIGLKKLVEDEDGRWAQPVGDVVLPALAVALPIVTLLTTVLMVTRIRYPSTFKQLLAGEQSRLHFLQVVFALAFVFVIKEMAVPIVFCWYAFSNPIQALCQRYWKLFRSRSLRADSSAE